MGATCVPDITSASFLASTQRPNFSGGQAEPVQSQPVLDALKQKRLE